MVAGSFGSGNAEIPDKVTVYSADGDSSHTFRHKTWVVDRTSDGDGVYVYVREAEYPSWVQSGDFVLASNMDGSDVAEEVADFMVTSVARRNERGDEPMMLMKGK